MFMMVLAILFLTVIVVVELWHLTRFGWRDWDSAQAWLAEVACFGIVASPLVLAVRSVNAGPTGITAVPFVGPSRTVGWDDVKSVGQYDAFGRFDRASSLVRIVPSRGRSITITAAMFNYDQVASYVLHAAGDRVSRRPGFLDMLIRKAR